MAKVEDLIKNIPDLRLRDEIARQVAKLKSQKQFGLVFEEHLREQVLLPGLSIKPGACVVKRGTDKEIFTVIGPAGGAHRNSRVRLVRESDGQEETSTAKELIVIKRFGEPIYPTLIAVVCSTGKTSRIIDVQPAAIERDHRLLERRKTWPP